MKRPTEVVIAGAGPTGLMAAALLTRCGVGVRILDKNEQSAHESRAFGVQAKSMELFLSMGLAEKFLDAGLMVSGAQIWVDGRLAASIELADIGRTDTPFSMILMVPQSETEKILLEDLRRLGIEVERDTEVVGFEQNAEGVTVRAVRHSPGDAAAEEPELSIGCRYLIGADGAHSTVRKELGLSFTGAPYPQSFLLADCRLDWALDYDHVRIFLNGHAFGAFFPLRGGRIVRVIAMEPPKAEDRSGVEQGAVEASLGEVEAAFHRASGQEVRLHNPVWVTRYKISHRGVKRYSDGRVFVAGDAAHIHSPAGGQGMNTGLQDAANLAWKIALLLKGSAPAALLDSYDAERRPVGEDVLEYTDKVFASLTNQSEWRVWMRDLLIPRVAGALARSGNLRNRAFHFMSQLGIRYDQGDFVQEDAVEPARAWRHAPSSGHRAPDAQFARNRDLFGLIDGYRFHVLAFSRIALTEPEIRELCAGLAAVTESFGIDNLGVDLRSHIFANSLVGRDERLHRVENNQILAAYGIDSETPQALVLVRPDGYIAYRANSLDLEGLTSFLRKLAPATAEAASAVGASG